MKKPILTFALLALFTLSFLPTFAQLSLPEASPDASIRQKLGFTNIKIDYFRPGAKGRKVFGGLVPYDKLWRTGASDATTISFSDPITIEGHKVPAGKYSLFSIPGEKEWTIILNKDSAMHGSSGYDEQKDLLRFQVTSEAAPRFYESFTIEVNDIIKNTAQLYLIWENTQVRMKLMSDADERVMAQINERINIKKEERPGLYYQAALYYFNNGKDLNQALAWAKQAVKMDEDANYMQLQAKLLAALKDYKSAIATAKKSSQIAKQKKMESILKANDQLLADWQAAIKGNK